MKIEIVRYGRPAMREAGAIVEVYRERLNAWCPVEAIELKDIPKSRSAPARKSSAAKAGGEILVACDERGRQWSSRELSENLKRWQDDPRVKSVRLVVGGPYGLPAGLREEAHEIWSLSRATLPSDLAWVIVWEQVYRAMSILRGSSYHHD